jgi:hypothetical protein
MAVYGPVRHQPNIIRPVAGHMAVYGPVRHRKNIYGPKILSSIQRQIGEIKT